MSYIRECKNCGQRISLRKMPDGQWVAFDVATDYQHICGQRHVPESDLARESIAGPKKFYLISGFIKKAIREKKRVQIEYYNRRNKYSSREISPIKEFSYQDRRYVQAYCHLRKAERSFLVQSISSAKVLKKKRFKPKRMSDPILRWENQENFITDPIESHQKTEAVLTNSDTLENNIDSGHLPSTSSDDRYESHPTYASKTTAEHKKDSPRLNGTVILLLYGLAVWLLVLAIV